MTEIAISVRHITKDFAIYERPVDLALELLTRRKRHRSHRALDDVSFDVQRGQVLGIIGANGAGKSTLLKIITGVLDATSGTVEVRGRVTAILELGLGFNPEHSGRDNIYLSGLLYGMTREEINRKLESIIDFSGLRSFIEQPVKTYSSGMHARLAFSIATAVDPEILIIDEALAAGDAMFVQKSMRRIRQLCAGGRTVLMVSHGTGILAQLCRNVIWLDQGRIKRNGPSLEVVQAYDLEAHRGADAQSWIEPVADAALTGKTLAMAERTGHTTGNPSELPAIGHLSSTPRYEADFIVQRRAATAFLATDEDQRLETGKYVFRRGPIFIESVTMLDHNGSPSNRLTTLQPFSLHVIYYCKGTPPEETLGVALAVNCLPGIEPVAQWYTQFIRPDETREGFAAAPFRCRPAPRGRIELAFPYTPFRQGDYVLSVGLLPNVPGTWEFYEYRHLFYPFHVNDGCLSLGAPIFFEPRHVCFAEVRGRAEEDEAASV